MILTSILCVVFVRVHRVCVCVLDATEQFLEKAVSYQQFSDNPSIIDDPNLVVKIGSKYVLLLLHIWTECVTYTCFVYLC